MLWTLLPLFFLSFVRKKKKKDKVVLRSPHSSMASKFASLTEACGFEMRKIPFMNSPGNCFFLCLFAHFFKVFESFQLVFLLFWFGFSGSLLVV